MVLCIPCPELNVIKLKALIFFILFSTVKSLYVLKSFSSISHKNLTLDNLYGRFRNSNKYS